MTIDQGVPPLLEPAWRQALQRDCYGLRADHELPRLEPARLTAFFRHGCDSEKSVTIQNYYRNVCAESDDVSDRLLHEQQRYRSVFISDLHLGTMSCCASELAQFLNHIQTEYLFLVGDIFDFWKLRIFNPLKIGKLLGAGVFSRSQLTVIQKLLRADRHGMKIIFMPGNHDEALRDFVGTRVNNIILRMDAVHETSDGRRFLVLHGDSFDRVIRGHRWLSILGTHALEVLAKLSIQIDRWRKNARINRALEYLGLESHWSLAHEIKTRSDGLTYKESYSHAMLTYLVARNAEIHVRRRRQPDKYHEVYFDGVICGHTHIPEIRRVRSPIDKETGEPIGPAVVTYFNTGHWTGRPNDEDNEGSRGQDSGKHPTCTAIVEHHDGRMEPVQWVTGQGIVSFLPLIPAMQLTR
ncbi:MAG: UDP-2,3-diacylglucosamine diphosphatase [Candidatus Binatia bacterium]